LAAARRLAGPSRPIGIMSPEPHPRQFFAGATGFRLCSPGLKRALFARHGVDFIYEPRFDAAFAGLSAEAFITDILVAGFAVNAVVAGADFRFGCNRAGNTELLKAHGASLGFAVVQVGPVKLDGRHCASSAVREFIRAGDITAATRMLGHEWAIEAVPAQDQFQRLLPLPELVMPSEGRYKVRFETVHGSTLAPCSQTLTIEGGGQLRLDAPAPPLAERIVVVFEARLSDR